MNHKNNKSHPDSAASRLLDLLLERQNLKSDAALCRLLDLSPPQLSKIRHGRTGMSGEIKIAIHMKTGMEIREIQAVLASQP